MALTDWPLEITGIQACLHLTQFCRRRAQSYEVWKRTHSRNDNGHQSFIVLYCYSGKDDDLHDAPSLLTEIGAVCSVLHKHVFANRYHHGLRDFLH
jgi:hypothetical protein